MDGQVLEHYFHSQNTRTLGQDNKSSVLISLNKLKCPQYKTGFFSPQQYLISTFSFYSDNKWTLFLGHTSRLAGT